MMGDKFFSFKQKLLGLKVKANLSYWVPNKMTNYRVKEKYIAKYVKFRMLTFGDFETISL